MNPPPNASAHKKKKAYSRGLWAEFIACMFLRLKGYRLLEKRFRTKVGEVDLIMQKGGILHFIEVKTRRRFIDAALAISPQQKKRIKKAATYYLYAHPHNGPIQFDAILVKKGMHIKHIQNEYF